MSPLTAPPRHTASPAGSVCLQHATGFSCLGPHWPPFTPLSAWSELLSSPLRTFLPWLLAPGSATVRLPPPWWLLQGPLLQNWLPREFLPLCWVSPRPRPGSWSTGTRHIADGLQQKAAKEDWHREKARGATSRGNQAQAARSLLPVGSCPMYLVPLSPSCDHTCEVWSPGHAPERLSAQGFYWGWSCRPPLPRCTGIPASQEESRALA